VSTRAELDEPEPRLTLTIDDSAWAHRDDIGWLRARGKTPLSGLIEDHGSLVHLFVIADDARSAFAHLHPSTADSVTFTALLPPLPAGNYRVFADIVHASGFAQTLTSPVMLPREVRVANAWNAHRDDSWGLGPTDGSARSMRLDDGTELTWLRDTTPLVVGAEADLRFAISTTLGDTAALEPYLGMAGHAVVVRDDGGVFIHLHPQGTISLAAQAVLSTGTPHVRHDSDRRALVDTLSFPYAFPASGKYAIWVQLKRRGRVLTGSFGADVAALSR
jgi:hypothetical protein